MDKNEKINQIKVNREFLADIFKCDVRTVQNYAAIYGMPRDERGEYPLFECLIWFVEKQRKDIDNLSKENPLNQERLESLKINNAQKRIRQQRELGVLVEMDQVNFVLLSIIKMLIRNVEAIAPRLNKKINGDAKTLKLIRDEIDEFRNLCADTPMHYFKNEFDKFNNSDQYFNK